jgi:hypothetical protein
MISAWICASRCTSTPATSPTSAKPAVGGARADHVAAELPGRLLFGDREHGAEQHEVERDLSGLRLSQVGSRWAMQVRRREVLGDDALVALAPEVLRTGG